MMRPSTRVTICTLILCASAHYASAQGEVRLSLKDAEDRAVQAHPQIKAGQYYALASDETTRQIRSSFFPTVQGSFTGAQAQDGTRIAAGGLNNPTILDRFAYGFSVSQMLTDFGRTHALTASSTLRTNAQEQDVAARRAEVLLRVDRAYFDVLRAQSIERVARQTVAARQLVVDQVVALANSGLKSQLDVSFARVNLSEAQLLLVQAANDVQASFAAMSNALGTTETAVYELSDEPFAGPPPDDVAPLIAKAVQSRPDIARERLSTSAAEKLAVAERDLWLPTVSLQGAGGLTPFHQVGLLDRYSAVGINVSVPLTNGDLYRARQAEATFRTSAAREVLRDAENRVTRDVKVSWLEARSAYQRLDLTNQLLSQATDALDLAQQRYDLGLSSIVELTQAQLNQTRAQIEQTTARYDYQAKTAALKFQMGDLK